MAIINKSTHSLVSKSNDQSTSLSIDQSTNLSVNSVMPKSRSKLSFRRLVGKVLRHRTSIGVWSVSMLTGLMTRAGAGQSIGACACVGRADSIIKPIEATLAKPIEAAPIVLPAD